MDITPATRASTVNRINATLVNHIFFPFIHSLFMVNWVCLNWQKMLIDAIRKHIELYTFGGGVFFFFVFGSMFSNWKLKSKSDSNSKWSDYFIISIQFHRFDWTMSSTTHIKLINTLKRFLCRAWLLLSWCATLFLTLEMYSLGSIGNWHHTKIAFNWKWKRKKNTQLTNNSLSLSLIQQPIATAFDFRLSCSIFPIDLHIVLWIVYG